MRSQYRVKRGSYGYTAQRKGLWGWWEVGDSSSESEAKAKIDKDRSDRNDETVALYRLVSDGKQITVDFREKVGFVNDVWKLLTDPKTSEVTTFATEDAAKKHCTQHAASLGYNLSKIESITYK